MIINRFYQVVLLLGAVIFLGRAPLAEESTVSLLKIAKQHHVAKATDASNTVRVSHKKSTTKQKRIAAKQENASHESEDASLSELQRPLDLSIPYADVDKSDRLHELDTDTSSKANIFAGDNRKKTRPVQIDGKLLMSPEPEVEKQKSADGAGIVINLKP
jgi:predicted choloylglycine hydrolase